MADQRADTPLAASDVWCPTCGHLLDPVTGEPAESAAAEPPEVRRLRGYLEQIKRDEGKVCEQYETCDHIACASSYSAWALADEALSRAGQPPRGSLDE